MKVPGYHMGLVVIWTKSLGHATTLVECFLLFLHPSGGPMQQASIMSYPFSLLTIFQNFYGFLVFLKTKITQVLEQRSIFNYQIHPRY